MAARKTALSMSAYTLGGTSFLADLQVFGLEIGASEAERHGLAATSAYTQVVKRSATHTFELVRDASGPAHTNLTVAAWTPDGSARLGDLKSGSLDLSIPVEDGSGLADSFEWANVVGARRIRIRAETLILASATDEPELADARSVLGADWQKPNVVLQLGDASFDLPMVLTSASHSFERDGLQRVSVEYALRGTPTAAPSAGLLGVAFSGSAVLSLVANTGVKTWSGNGVIESLSMQFDDGAIQKLTGTLRMQGQPGWA